MSEGCVKIMGFITLIIGVVSDTDNYVATISRFTVDCL